MLSPLSKSQYTVRSTKEFTNHIKKQKVPSNYEIIPFEVISLFTNVPEDATIDIILKRIYERKEINTSFTKQELKELILPCTKKEFTLLYTVKVTFKQIKLLWVPSWGQYYPQHLW